MVQWSETEKKWLESITEIWIGKIVTHSEITVTITFRSYLPGANQWTKFAAGQEAKPMDLLSALVECTASGDTVQENGHELVNFKHVRVPTRREEPVVTSCLHPPCEGDQGAPSLHQVFLLNVSWPCPELLLAPSLLGRKVYLRLPTGHLSLNKHWLWPLTLVPLKLPFAKSLVSIQGDWASQLVSSWVRIQTPSSGSHACPGPPLHTGQEVSSHGPISLSPRYLTNDSFIPSRGHLTRFVYSCISLNK